MEEQRWRRVTDRYFTPEQKADFARQMAQLPPDFSQEDYSARWKDLGARIKVALPLDPHSDRARAFLAEWKALLAPFTRVATPEMQAGVSKMYERMGEWQGQADPGFDKQVFDFIREVGRANGGSCEAGA